MKRFGKYFSLLFVLIFASCEDVVQVSLDEGSRLYVIDAFVNDLPQVQRVKVNYTQPYFSDSQAPAVSGARVFIRDLTAGRNFEFQDAGDGEHVFVPDASDPMAIIGHQYELRVAIGSYTYNALTTLKRTAVIRRIDTTYISGAGGFGGSQEPFYFCTLVAKDTVDAVPDYYRVKTFRNDSLLFSAQDLGLSLCIDGTGGAVTETGTDTINFTPPVTFLAFKQFRNGDKCRVEVHSLSRDTYYFLLQAAQQVTNGGLFATTPENVKTNIKTPAGAPVSSIGWFNMAAVAEKEIFIP